MKNYILVEHKGHWDVSKGHNWGIYRRKLGLPLNQKKKLQERLNELAGFYAVVHQFISDDEAWAYVDWLNGRGQA